MALNEYRHLGGYFPADDKNPNGDPWTWTPGLWAFLLEEFKPATLLDIGCGEGHSTKWFLDQGIDAHGIEGSPEAMLHAVIPRNLFHLHDFTLGAWTTTQCYDMIWCCEFVEHVEEQYLNNVLDLFGKAKTVCMTHATPGQIGHNHVNCQPASYWIEKLGTIGFSLNEGITLASKVFAPNIHWGHNGMIFVK